MFKYDFRPILKFILVSALFLTAGIIAGSIAAGRMGNSESDSMAAYLGGALGDIKIGDRGFINSFLIWLTVWAMIAVSGGVLPGCLLNLGAVTYRGFVTGYTAACFYRAYAMKGFFLCFSLLPEILLTLPALTAFSSFSLKMSFSKHENKKKLCKSYLLICTIFIAIFCVISLFQAYLTTIFMKLAFSFLN